MDSRHITLYCAYYSTYLQRFPKKSPKSQAMDKFVGDQLLALSKYSREQKGRRTYLLRCKKVGSVGKVGWEVILRGWS